MSVDRAVSFFVLSLASTFAAPAFAADPDSACPTPAGLPGPGFEVASAADGTYTATFTGELVALDAGRSQVSVRAGGRTVAFGAYGAILDLAGYQLGDRVTVGFDASYSDHTHEPLRIARAEGRCPSGVAAQGFVLAEGRVGDFDLGFAGKVKETGTDFVVVRAGGQEVRLATLEGYVVPGSVQKGQAVTAYFRPVRGANRVYLIVDEAGTEHRPGVPVRQEEGDWGW